MVKIRVEMEVVKVTKILTYMVNPQNKIVKIVTIEDWNKKQVKTMELEHLILMVFADFNYVSVVVVDDFL